MLCELHLYSDKHFACQDNDGKVGPELYWKKGRREAVRQSDSLMLCLNLSLLLKCMSQFHLHYAGFVILF